MKQTINGKRYDTEKCKILAVADDFRNGNLIAKIRLLEANDGQLLIYTHSYDNYHATSGLVLWENSELTIDEFETIEDEARLVEIGLLSIVA